jgi:hypothetical protein
MRGEINAIAAAQARLEQKFDRNRRRSSDAWARSSAGRIERENSRTWMGNAAFRGKQHRACLSDRRAHLRQPSTSYPYTTNFNEDAHFRLRAAILRFRQCAVWGDAVLITIAMVTSREIPDDLEGGDRNPALSGDALHYRRRRSTEGKLDRHPALSGDALALWGTRIRQENRLIPRDAVHYQCTKLETIRVHKKPGGDVGSHR